MDIDNLLGGRDVLVVEDELLIALDVERIVLDCGAMACQIVRGVPALELFIDDHNASNIVIVDERSFHRDPSVFTALIESFGAAIVLTTSRERPQQLIGNARVSIVQKPFVSTDIVTALIEQLRDQRPTAGIANT